MTLVVVLLFGLGTVLVLSALQVDANGKSLSVAQTIQNIWANQPVTLTPPTQPASNGGGSAGTFASTSPATAVPLSGTASTAAFLASHQV